MMTHSYRAVRWLNQFRHRTKKTLDDITYELDLAQEIDGAIYFKRGFEPETTAAFRALVRPGDIAFDVGANIGCHALSLAKLVQPAGSVVAFEPIQWAFKKLTRNAALNPGLHNLRLEKLAVSSHSASSRTITFRASWPTFGCKPGIFTDAVEVITIDDYMARSRLPHLDLVKIDVDGFEHKVIRGAKNTLERWAPALVMELGAYTLTAVGDNLNALLQTIFTAGYLVFHERTHEQLSSHEEIAACIPEQHTINVVCLHREDPRLFKWATVLPGPLASTCSG
jgi:FkbM family methyltransferase